jgi:hypothetical protein
MLHDEACVEVRATYPFPPLFEINQERFPEAISNVLNRNPLKKFNYPCWGGLMLPYDSSMVLSLGETQARRVGVYTPSSLSDSGQGVSYGYYAPFWRLNSCIDNFRFYMGPSDPHHSFYSPGNIPLDFFNIRSSLYEEDSPAMPKNNFLGAARYYVSNISYVDKNIHPELAHLSTREPSWKIKPKFEGKSTLLSCGARIYYPNSLLQGEPPNCPYVELDVQVKKGMLSLSVSPKRVSYNEQQFFFHPTKFSQDLTLKLQYRAYKPLLDGNLETPTFDNNGYLEDPYNILEYRGYIDRETGASHGRHFVNLPWIKEVNFRVIPPKGEQILSWEEK